MSHATVEELRTWAMQRDDAGESPEVMVMALRGYAPTQLRAARAAAVSRRRARGAASEARDGYATNVKEIRWTKRQAIRAQAKLRKRNGCRCAACSGCVAAGIDAAIHVYSARGMHSRVEVFL